jgi:apolipoprotein N-acyltransferase
MKKYYFQEFLLLAIGLLLLLVSNGRWIVPVATWLFSIFIIRFLRNQKNWRHILIFFMAYLGVFCIVWKGLIQLSGFTYYAVAGGIGIAFFLPFLLDKILTPRSRGFISTLVFPLAYTVVEYIGFQFTPYGSWGSLAYTQYGNLPLMQIVSITGIYGLTFLITWFASVVNWSWEQNFDWSKINKGVKIYASVMAAVLLYGGANLVLLSPKSNEVKVAGVQSHIAEKVLEPVNEKLSAGDYSEAVWKSFFTQTNIIIDDLFAKSEIAAKGGAKIVSWAENPVMIPKGDEPAFIDRGKNLAKQQQIYLLLNYSINFHTDPRRVPKEKMWSTRVVIVSPEGEVLSTYRKTILVPGMEAMLAVSGNDDAAVISTPFGRISSLICFDNDFPAFVRKQVGKEGVDILFDPSGDWKDIDPYHTNMMAFRAIENGFSVLRVTGLGLSAAYDYQGRTLATMDYFKTNDKVFTAYVPEKGVGTIYSQIGDLFAWLAIAGLIVLIGRVIMKRKYTILPKREA